MIDFLNRLFGRQSSGATAKERLRLVLMSDHLSLAPEMIEAMKRDLIDVVSRYVEVDRERIDVHFENQDRALAMLANIPITGVNRNSGPDGGAPPEPREHAQPVASTPVATDSERPSEDQAEPKQPAAAPRKRRRKRSAAASQNGNPVTAT